MSRAHRRSWSRAASWFAGALLFLGARGAAGGATTQDAPAKESRTVLVTGANRGLGLEFAKQFSDAGWKVIATAREPDKAEELHQFGESVQVVQLDVTDAKSVAALAKALEKQPIDLLINNAGSACRSRAGRSSRS